MIVLTGATALSAVATGTGSLWIAVVPGLVLSIAGLVAQVLVDDRNKGETRPVWTARRPPYPGLEAFSDEDAAVFFGRSAETDELTDRLHPAVRGARQSFVAVVGPSGSGKSSLVQAGLIPALSMRRTTWLVVPPLRPGDHPVHSLAQALAASPVAASGRGATTSVVEGRLREGGAEELVRLVDELRVSSHRRGAIAVLLVVDQFEELFTQADPVVREEFLSLLRAALQRDPALWVVATIRSEFLTPLLASSFAPLVQRPVMVGALGRDALSQIVEEPAALAGLRFAAGVVARIVDDTGSGDALPLLAFTLQQLFLRVRDSGVVRHEDYDRLGGVSGALVRQAERVTAELRIRGISESDVLRVVSRFVTLDGAEPTRRRVRRETFGSAELDVVDAFVEARLLTTRPGEGGVVVDVAHEALFRHWAPLRQDLDARADYLRRRSQVEHWAQDWERSGRDRHHLLRDERLRAVMRWVDEQPGLWEESPLAREFLETSRRNDTAWLERLSDSLAQQARLTTEVDPELALLLAITAVEECAPRPAAFAALHAALETSRQRAVLAGHTAWVWDVVWSPDGRRLLSASHDHTARVWDVERGEQTCLLQGHSRQVEAAAWSPDGTSVVTASQDGTARVWNSTTGEEVVVLLGHEHRLTSVAWSPDGALVATGARDHTVRLWNPHTGESTALLAGHQDWVTSVRFSPDSTRLATASGDRTVRLWDLSALVSDGSATEVTGHRGWIDSVDWSPDGTRLVTGSRDRTARMWDAATCEQRLVLHGHQGDLTAVTWAPDGSRVASASRDNTARLWNADEGAAQLVLRGHQDWVTAAAWSPDSGRVATASRDTTIRVWDARPSPERLILTGHTGWVRTVSWSPEATALATGSRDGTARIWDARTGTQTRLLRHEGEVRGCHWSPDGRLLVTGSYDRTVRVWDVRTGASLLTLTGHEEGLRRALFSPDGSRIASCGRDDTVRVWDVRTGEQLTVFQGHEAMVRSLTWSPDGSHLLSGSNDATARMWRVEDGAQIAVLDAHDDGVNGVGWSPDGTLAATASRDRTVRIWRVPEQSQSPQAPELLHLLEQVDVVRDLAWSPCGTRLALAYDDCTARVWHVAEEVEVAVLRGHEAWVEGVAWSADGAHVLTASGDGTARVWDAVRDKAALLTVARGRVSRGLTAEERHRFLLPEAE
ncbi:AAA family ATPase [Streptomyces sp. NPDC001604]|uniref:nSTAND1 domain-containing NTPase n=1 Tax=Streptomyces sp. NPDC001604 TaxID=3364593 RepID=UPI00368EC763